MSSIIFESSNGKISQFLANYCVFSAIQLVNARVIVQTVLLSFFFFSDFIFSVPFKVLRLLRLNLALA